MSRLAVSIDSRFTVKHPAGPHARGPRATAGANVRTNRPFWLSPFYLRFMAGLTALAMIAMTIALWRLMHYPR